MEGAEVYESVKGSIDTTFLIDKAQHLSEISKTPEEAWTPLVEGYSRLEIAQYF